MAVVESSVTYARKVGKCKGVMLKVIFKKNKVYIASTLYSLSQCLFENINKYRSKTFIVA